MRYPFLAGQLFNAPLVARPETADAFARAFVRILEGVAPSAAAEVAIRHPVQEAYASGYAAERFRGKAYAVTDSGIGILPVYGVLAQRAGEITPTCAEMTSYERLGRRFAAMMSDPDVQAILLEVDSPGGQVAGNFELARRIVSARGQKPIWAHANEMALSGGYSIAAAAQQAYVPDTGLLGSIGVVMLHMSQAERDAKQGYQYTAIYAGDRKVDGNPHEPLSDSARAHLQAMVDSSYAIFTEHVAASRGMSVEDVRATQAAVFVAADAVKAKLADGIATFAETLDRLESSLRGAFVSVPGASALNQQHPVAGSAATITPKGTAMSDKQHDTPAAPVNTDAATPKSDTTPVNVDAARLEARTQERARVASILNAAEAEGRAQLASYIAFETEMSVDDAKRFLVKAPAAAQAKSDASPFLKAMNELGNPKIGSGPVTAADDADAIARRIAGV